MIGLLATAIVVRGWRDGLRLDRLVIAAGLALIAVTFAVLTTMLDRDTGAGAARPDRGHGHARRVGAAGRRRVRARPRRTDAAARRAVDDRGHAGRAGGRGRSRGVRPRAGAVPADGARRRTAGAASAAGRDRAPTRGRRRPRPRRHRPYRTRGALGATCSRAGSGSPCCSSRSPSSTTPCCRRSPTGCTWVTSCGCCSAWCCCGRPSQRWPRPSPRARPRASAGGSRATCTTASRRSSPSSGAAPYGSPASRTRRTSWCAADRALLDSRWAIEHLRERSTSRWTACSRATQR